MSAGTCVQTVKIQKNSNIRSKRHEHTSNSFSCPLLQIELKALMNRTMGNTGGEVAKNAIST